MDNKKYIDKVLDHLVRGTKIDYEKGIVSTNISEFVFLSTYCKNTFGLTDEEINYVWKEYKDIITDKINNGQ